MMTLKIAAAIGAMVLLVPLAGPANAATASNSQAGAEGHNKNNVKNVGDRAKTVRHRKM